MKNGQITKKNKEKKAVNDNQSEKEKSMKKIPRNKNKEIFSNSVR